MPFKLDPVKRSAFFLTLFAGGALVFNFSSDVALHLAATVGFALTLYAFYSWATNKHKNIWDTLITSLILFLVLHYGAGLTDLVYPLLATFLAITQKFFIEFKNSPVINPVAFGLLLTALIVAFIPGWERPFVSWWGASYQGYVSLAIIALWIVGGLYEWKKWYAVGAYLVAFAVLLLVRGEGLEAVRFALTDSTLYFFATFMLVEPKTSPFKPKEQVAYGIFVALLASGFLYWSTPYPELFALVAANLAFLGMRSRPKPVSITKPA